MLTDSRFMQYPLPVIGSVLMALFSTAILVYYKNKQRRRSVGCVNELVIYPIKACRGISVKWAHCTELGLRYKNLMDR